MDTNHRPAITGTDYGIWRRVRLIPFNERYPDGDPRRDKNLKEKLWAAELDAIFSWIVEGCAEWLRSGLEMPDSVRNATADYQNAEDVLGGFLTEHCNYDPDKANAPGAPQGATIGSIYTVYKQWAIDSGLTPKSQKTIGQQLRERNYKIMQNHQKQMVVCGLFLASTIP